MDEATVKQLEGVAGGLTAGEMAQLELAYTFGTRVGEAFNAGVQAVGGWAAYLEQVGIATGNAE